MKYIGTSWKMNHTVSQANEYAKNLMEGLPDINMEFLTPFVIPPFTSIENVRHLLPNSIWVGAQNMHWQDSGAYTGEISAPMLKDIGADLVEIGHSERRLFFNESDKTVGLKVWQALKYRLKPLVCVGEPLEIKERGQSIDYVNHQIEYALKGIATHEGKAILLAYEPFWAIGESGLAAEPAYVGTMLCAIKEICVGMFSNCSIPVIYGGSVSLETVTSYLELENCDGLFVGRAAWQAQGFLEILRKAQSLFI